jgi:branched-chain amino acid transport system permease protein
VSNTLLRHLAIAAAAGVVLYVLSGQLSQFNDLQLATMAYSFCAVAGLTVLTGLNGQISLGHGALMAVGAYTTAKLLGEEGTGPPLVLALIAATVAGALAGLLAGAAAARLRGPYLAGATLALAVGLPAIADRFPKFLGASNGLTVAPPIPPGETFALERWQACIACLAALAVYVVLANLVRSRLGRALLVVVTSVAAPGAFPLALSVALLTGAILGGLGSLAGAAWGAAALALIPTWADDASQSLNLSTNVQANLALAVYGVVLIGVMLAAPQGIQGALRRLFNRRRSVR